MAFCEMELETSRDKRANLEAALKEKEADSLNSQKMLLANVQELDLLKTKVREVTEALGEKSAELEKMAETNVDVKE